MSESCEEEGVIKRTIREMEALGFDKAEIDPQGNALRVALGLRDGAAPDRLRVGLAVLSLLSEAAAERATVCLVDDAQWVDRASLQALVFAARRLSAEPVMYCGSLVNWTGFRV